MKIKPILKSLVGDKMLGRYDYLLKPKLVDSWGGAFNGQSYRQRIFLDLIRSLPVSAIVETGTFRGTTTAFLAKTGLPVYTVESNPRIYAYVALRFYCQRGQIHLHEGDSVRFLRHLADRKEIPISKVFFYLDAHGEDYLPLQEELELIFAKWNESVVMVDDFQVPGTTYGYDDYGPGKELTMSYLKPLQHLHLSAFFPAIDAAQETGKKRGCVVLCKDEAVKSILEGIESLAPRL